MRVKWARSPETALALLIEQNYDLVITKLRMEDLQSVDVLTRAKKLNPEVKIMVVSDDLNAAFPLEAYRIEVDDYLLLPIATQELVRRIKQCLGRVDGDPQPEVPAGGREGPLNQEWPTLSMMMLHDLRGGLVSLAASLKLLGRGKYGAINSQVGLLLEDLIDKMRNSAKLLDDFAHEVLARGPG